LKYSIKKGIIKGLKYFVIFLIPVIIDKVAISFPVFWQMTTGGVIVIIYNYLKIKVISKLP